MSNFLDLNPMGVDNTPTYFYRVNEFLTTFGAGKKSFEDTKEFKDNDLVKARGEALAYYLERANGIESRGHFFKKQLVAPDANFDIEKSAAYSIDVCLVESYASGDELEHNLFEDETSLENEKYILESLGFELAEI